MVDSPHNENSSVNVGQTLAKSADVEDSPHKRFDHHAIDKLGIQNKTEYVGCLVGQNNARKSYHVEDWSRITNFD